MMPQKRHTAFQLTPSRRATWIYRTIGEFFSFQLTPSRRATHRISMILSRQDISTHALTEGDVTVLLDSIVKWLISTHALTEGDGDFPQLNRFYRSYFNSRPHGGRPWCLTTTSRRRYFNSRPHGGRQSIRRLRLRPRYFNSRPHGGRLLRFHHPASFPYFNSRPHGGRQR